MPGRSKSHWWRLLLALLAVSVTLPTGCTREHLSRLRGSGFDERSNRMTAEIPSREEAGKPYSFSSKAQEIEANFGFQ